MTEQRAKLVRRLREEFPLGTPGRAAADEIEGLEGILGAVEWFLENNGYGDHAITSGVRDVIYGGKYFRSGSPVTGTGSLGRDHGSPAARSRRHD